MDNCVLLSRDVGQRSMARQPRLAGPPRVGWQHGLYARRGPNHAPVCIALQQASLCDPERNCRNGTRRPPFLTGPIAAGNFWLQRREEVSVRSVPSSSLDIATTMARGGRGNSRSRKGGGGGRGGSRGGGKSNGGNTWRQDKQQDNGGWTSLTARHNDRL